MVTSFFQNASDIKMGGNPQFNQVEGNQTTHNNGNTTTIKDSYNSNTTNNHDSYNKVYSEFLSYRLLVLSDPSRP